MSIYQIFNRLRFPFCGWRRWARYEFPRRWNWDWPWSSLCPQKNTSNSCLQAGKQLLPTAPTGQRLT